MPSDRARVRVIQLARRAVDAVRALWLLVVPVDCAGCARPDVALCGRCAALLRVAPVAVPADVGVPVVACAPYTGAVSRLVVAWKDRGRQDLTPALAVPLARSAAALLAPPARPARRRLGRTPAGVLLVPVPSSARACRERGADVAAALAARAAAQLRAAGHQVRVAPVLCQRRRVADQSGLGASGRRANVSGAFALRRGTRATRLAGAVVLVVDDVVTTGASAGEACRVLGRAGASVRGVAAVAWTPLRSAAASGVAVPREGGECSQDSLRGLD